LYSLFLNHLDYFLFNTLTFDVKDEEGVVIMSQPICEFISLNKGIVVENYLVLICSEVDFNAYIYWGGFEFGNGIYSMVDY
jgi:hypothetical protein